MNEAEENDLAENEPTLTPEQRRGHLYSTLSWLWIFPSFGACWILGMDAQHWFKAPSAIGFLTSIRLEEWLALSLLWVHGVFIFRARRYRKALLDERKTPN